MTEHIPYTPDIQSVEETQGSFLREYTPTTLEVEVCFINSAGHKTFRGERVAAFKRWKQQIEEAAAAKAVEEHIRIEEGYKDAYGEYDCSCNDVGAY